MTDVNAMLSEFIAKRKAIVADTLRKGGEQQEALLKQYGAPSQLDAAVSGLQQGFMHGFADDMERAERGDGVAKKHILSKATRPWEYEISALLGALASAGGLRVGLQAAGNMASKSARAGAAVSGAAGGAAAAAKSAQRAERIQKGWTTLGMSPAHRGTVMDAGHGALFGYGGTDVRVDEPMVSPERFGRAAMGAGFSAIAAPVATSGVVAAANAPIAFGGRRAFSQPMLEPPGVVTPQQSFWSRMIPGRQPVQANPAGRPRDAIDIARSRDETAARGGGSPGIVARDTAPPLQSTQRQTQQLADQALAPVAPERIAHLRGQERNAAAASLERSVMPPPQQTPWVQQMMEAFVRQDAPALNSWVSTLRSANRQDPMIMPQVRAAVTRQLAINERSNPALNDTPVMRQFLTALGMSGNSRRGAPNVLEAARAPARAQFPTGRYEDALTRTQGQTPMRPRHAEAIRNEMQTYQPGPYTGPADPRRGPPTVARGDDQPYFISPMDFFRSGKINDAQVTMAGFAAGPIAYAGEDYAIKPLMKEFVVGSEGIRMPQEQPQGMLADLPAQAGLMPQDEPAMPPRPMPQAPAPRPAPSPVQAMPQTAPQQAPARNERDIIMDIQAAMIEAGIPVGGRDGQPDGIVGPKTQRAIELFTMGGQSSLEDIARRIRNYPRGRLAQILSQ